MHLVNVDLLLVLKKNKMLLDERATTGKIQYYDADDAIKLTYRCRAKGECI